MLPQHSILRWLAQICIPPCLWQPDITLQHLALFQRKPTWAWNFVQSLSSCWFRLLLHKNGLVGQITCFKNARDKLLNQFRFGSCNWSSTLRSAPAFVFLCGVLSKIDCYLIYSTFWAASLYPHQQRTQ